MLFISGHFENENICNTLIEKYTLQFDKIVFCGSCNFNFEKDLSLAYHPLFKTENRETTVAQQHAYIDAMLRALQIEVPQQLLVYNATHFDTYTVLKRIAEHCAIVGIVIEKL
jgi:hypothetical protein